MSDSLRTYCAIEFCSAVLIVVFGVLIFGCFSHCRYCCCCCCFFRRYCRGSTALLLSYLVLLSSFYLPFQRNTIHRKKITGPPYLLHPASEFNPAGTTAQDVNRHTLHTPCTFPLLPSPLPLFLPLPPLPPSSPSSLFFLPLSLMGVFKQSHKRACEREREREGKY